MPHRESGQSLVEAVILTALVAMASLAALAAFHAKVDRFIDLVLAVIASPVP